MADKEDLTSQQRAARGKRLLAYGMFALVLTTTVALFLILWLTLAPLGVTGDVIRITLIYAAVAIIASVIIWFIYTRAILKE